MKTTLLCIVNRISFMCSENCTNPPTFSTYCKLEAEIPTGDRVGLGAGEDREEVREKRGEKDRDTRSRVIKRKHGET